MVKSKHEFNAVKYSHHLWAGAALAAILVVAVTNHPSQAIPTDGVVVKGAANIAISGGNIIISQTVPRAVINWAGFDVAAGENVEFKTPNNNGATLNNIGGASSQILGHVTSNGTLYFVNQNGFVFGPQSSITARNLVIASQTVNPIEFMSNKDAEIQKFSATNNPNAIIMLNGAIEVANHGVLAVFAPHIETSATARLVARQGSIVLGGGNINRIEFADDGLIKFELSSTGKDSSVINNGYFDVSLDKVLGGNLILRSENGTVILGDKIAINIGNSGTFTYIENSKNTDIVVDTEFLQKINYQPSMNLILSSGRHVILNTPLLGDNKSRMDFSAGQAIDINAALSSGRLSLTASYVRIYHDLTIGHGGITIITHNLAPNSDWGILIDGGKAAFEAKMRLTDEGDINLTAQNGGGIYLGNPIEANNIFITSNNGDIHIKNTVNANNITINSHYGDVNIDNMINANNINVNSYDGDIVLRGKVYAENKTGSNSSLIVNAYNFGNIYFNEDLIANNITVNADNGSIVFGGVVTAKAKSIMDSDNGKLNVNIKLANNDIIFKKSVFSKDIKVKNNYGLIHFLLDIHAAPDENAILNFEMNSKGDIILDRLISIYNFEGTFISSSKTFISPGPIYAWDAKWISFYVANGNPWSLSRMFYKNYSKAYHMDTPYIGNNGRCIQEHLDPDRFSRILFCDL